jgi:ferredoxin-NADP reductase
MLLTPTECEWPSTSKDTWATENIGTLWCGSEGWTPMLNISAIVAGIAFVTLAATNVVVMLEASQPSRNGTTRTRLIALHKAGGYLFVILLCIMAYSMSQRLVGVGITGHLPTYLVLHVVLVLVLVPLLFVKVLIARRYKHSHSSLKALGIAIFVISFALVSIPTLSELLRSASPGSLGLRLATGLVVVACLVQCALVFKKRKQSRASIESRIPEIPPQATALTKRESAKDPMNLLLAQTEQQTHDTKTLRFQVPKERRFRAKPGQFLTFQWTVDGRRVTRSYTISSSPIHEDYVEITPKRIENGCASVFLNERAKPSLIVEASGPYGRFYFDEKVHKSIVLIAAGSGITPMISMLRYIDDLKLTTPVTLLYCVRTRADIIFQNELKRLGSSLPNFKYEVCLSRPDPTWKGHSGRLGEEFVSQHLPDRNSPPTFFLCGPQGFMENARQTLSALGVTQDRILQESFGENKPSTESCPLNAGTVETVVFLHSEKVCQVSSGSTLLDLAERNGVQIPFGCRQGQCGTCATRLLSGTVQMDVEAGLTAEQKDAGYVLPCVSRANGTVVLSA